MFKTDLKSRISLRFLSIIFAGLVIVALTSSVCSAEEWSRKGKGEFFAFGQQMSGPTATVSGSGSTMEFDDTIAGGFGIGTNFNDHINVNTELFFGSADLTGRAGGATISGDTTLLGWDINLDINILKGRLTPVITGGIGFVRFDGDWEGVPAEETDFSYNVGGGLRWDITNHFLLKAMYKATWTKMEDTDEAIRFDGANVTIGYMF